MQVKILQDILSANERMAMKNRRLFDEKSVFAINLMSSPGAGKTSLILETIRKLKDRVKIAVIEGDIASSLDAEKISKENVTALQINTGGSCHLDANMINNALESMSLEGTDLLIIENVGNLICPAEFALGVHRKAMISSTPEGDDKPYKYPLMFSEADAVLINKIDLLPYVEFDIANFSRGVRALNPQAKIIEVSCKTGQGIDNWVSWLSSQMKT